MQALENPIHFAHKPPTQPKTCFSFIFNQIHNKDKKGKREKERERERERDLDGIVGANVVLINCLQPTNIIVGVRNQMDIELSGDYALGSIVHHELGFNTYNSCQKDQPHQHLGPH